ncbi:DNA polymerase III subunit beta [Aureimonas glaciei]|uniref:Beta sliding clamp n=1 Tax=Aureimonas glaciei TaxID=1776957 RepID=A0A916XXJ8_9HYPH|nr:DNA polymerase III subunit beta [Aureimonas glaciei]GGD20060.1 DNA polymerase III subunit beta [Aureimonas glaciei]
MTTKAKTENKEAHVPRPTVIKATVPTSALRKAVALVKKAQGSWSGCIPILNCVTICAKKGEKTIDVEFRGVDERVIATIEGSGDGAVAVSVRTLDAFLSGVMAETVEINKDAGDAAVTFSTPTFSLAMVPNHVEDTPEFKWDDDAVVAEFSLAEGVLAHLLALTMPFISREETRYYLNGVMMTVADDTLIAVATDGHRLGRRQAKLTAPCAPLLPSIVPRGFITLANAALGKGEVAVRFTNTQVEMRSGSVMMRSKLIDGVFPDYNRVIPAIAPHTIRFKAADTLPVLTAVGRSRAGSFSANAMKLTPGGGGISIECRVPDGETMTAKLDAAVEGEPPVMGFNARYILGAFKALGGKEMHLNTADSHTPARLTSPTGAEGDLVVIMPMRV